MKPETPSDERRTTKAHCSKSTDEDCALTNQRNSCKDWSDWGMGWMTGFEPATSGSTIRRSNQLSYTHHPGTRRYAPRQGIRILAKKEESPQLDGNASPPGIESGLHFRQDCGGGGSRIRGISDRSADHQVVSPCRNRLGRRGCPRVVIDVFAGRAHTRRDD